MPRKEHNILAVNPGTKYLGLAVFQSSDLVYWGVKTLDGEWSRDKIRSTEKILMDLADRYTVTVLVVKKQHSSRSSRSLDCLTAAVGRFARKSSLKVRFYSLDDLKKSLMPGMKANRMDIAGIIAARYRFLIPVLEKERQKKHPYFIRMFEAIAAGMVNSLHRI